MKENDRRFMRSMALAVALAVALPFLVIGCVSYKGGKITEGTDIAVGMSIPQSGGTFQVDALNLVTGFRFLFAEDAGVKCVYTVTNTVSAFGIYTSTTVKSVDIELTPTVNVADGEDCEKDNEGDNDGAEPSQSK